jgi:hypothetical protein
VEVSLFIRPDVCRVTFGLHVAGEVAFGVDSRQ